MRMKKQHRAMIRKSPNVLRQEKKMPFTYHANRERTAKPRNYGPKVCCCSVNSSKAKGGEVDQRLEGAVEWLLGSIKVLVGYT